MKNINQSDNSTKDIRILDNQNINSLYISKEEILNEVDQLVRKTEKPNKDLFIAKSVNKWIEEAKNTPVPNKLFGEFWHEGEVSILFADTNVGKSILAVQIANSISKGESIFGFKQEVSKQKVLYFDFELSPKQFEARYSREYTDHYQFDENLMRVEINPDADIPEGKSMEEHLIECLENSIVSTSAKVLIIDNITYLKNETEKAKDALPLMKHLKELKNKYNLSILVLAHTPKRDFSKPITRNDLQGSKMLINFCDSAFAIGENHNDKFLRYIKQIKQRNTELIYDSDNVCVCQITKPYNFLQFDRLYNGKEREHLKTLTDNDKEEQNKKIIELYEQQKSLRDIAEELNTNHMHVKRVIDKHKNNL